jgi:hypothetical protein
MRHCGRATLGGEVVFTESSRIVNTLGFAADLQVEAVFSPTAHGTRECENIPRLLIPFAKADVEHRHP